MKNLFKKVKEDKFLRFTCIASLLFILFHFPHIEVSQSKLEAIIRIVLLCFIVILTFFFHKKGFSIALAFTAFLMIFDNEIHDYTPIFLLILATHAFPRAEKIYFIIYVFLMLDSFIVQEKNFEYIFVQLFGSGIFCFCHTLLCEKKKPTELILTNDEKLILEELLKGKQQKEIELFSKNTVTKKLKHAKERNHIVDTKDLITEYGKSRQSDLSVIEK